MKPLLRCLLVEDSEDGSRLVLRQLRDGGYDVSSERVAAPEAMQTALDRGPWDIVISAYSLPDTTISGRSKPAARINSSAATAVKRGKL